MLQTLIEASDRFDAQSVRRENGARDRLCIEGCTQAVRETDSEGVVVADSPSWRAYAGRTLEEWLGYGWVNAIHPDDRAYAERQWREAVSAGGLVNADFRLQAPDGGWRWADVRAAPVLDADGTIEKWAGMNIDVREGTEARLRASEERYRGFVTASSDVVYRMSADWREMSHLDDRGFLPDTAEPDATWMERYIPPDDQPTVREAIERAIRAKSTFDLEHQVRQADGRLGWTHSRAVPILNDAGEVTEWLGAAKDVTNRREAEKRLRTSEELFRSFAENSTDTLWILDVTKGRLDYLSPAFAAMFGADPEDVTADLGCFADLVHPNDRGPVAQAIPRVLSGGETYQLVYRITRPSDGRERWIQDTGFPIRDAGGRIARIGGVAQDVAERREADDALRDSEAQPQVMVAELQHRTRNLIGVVGSVARQTMAETGPTETFQAEFRDRLEALSRVQGLLSRSGEERTARKGRNAGCSSSGSSGASR